MEKWNAVAPGRTWRQQGKQVQEAQLYRRQCPPLVVRYNRSMFSLGFRARGQHKKGHGRDDRLKILHVVMWASSPMMYMKACGYSRVRQTATKGAPVGPLRQKDNTSMPPCSIHFCVGSIGSQQGRGEKRARAKCNHPHFG